MFSYIRFLDIEFSEPKTVLGSLTECIITILPQHLELKILVWYMVLVDDSEENYTKFTRSSFDSLFPHLASDMTRLRLVCGEQPSGSVTLDHLSKNKTFIAELGNYCSLNSR
jgi:hypothetical protein